jgi:hypothetical protein
MKIRMSVEGKPPGEAMTGTLDDCVAARDFASLLPLTLTLEDYAATERIADPPRKLTTTGAPAGATPEAGDICYYAPWGNLALFYRGAPHASGLVKLGRIDGGADVLRRPGSLTLKIERI